jgi:hypothetical protein
VIERADWHMLERIHQSILKQFEMLKTEAKERFGVL